MPPSLPRTASTGPVRLSASHEAWVCAVLAGLTISGGLWLVYHHLVPRGEMMATNPIESWSLRVHGGLAMIALVLMGSLLRQHIGAAWRLRRSRRSGGLMLGAMICLAVTGYLLYYVSSEPLRDAASWLHWGLGLALPVFLIAHLQLGGRFARAARPFRNLSR